MTVTSAADDQLNGLVFTVRSVEVDEWAVTRRLLCERQTI